MKFSSDPVQLALPANTQLHHKIRTFLGHYDLRVYVTPRSYIDVDRGSFDAALMVRYSVEAFEGCVGTVGQFCTFANGSELFGGGEHWNELPVNIVFNAVPMLGGYSRSIADLQPKPQVPFTIGNGVVISGHAKVLGGASIEDGAVVAAGAIVVGVLPAFSICGGVPAKPIKQRFDAAAVNRVRWWDFEMAYLANNLARLQQLAVDAAADHVYRKPTPRLVLKFANETNDLSVALLHEGALHPLTAAPKKVQDYVKQIPGPGPYQWLANMWE